jgi:hypothetical protein
MFPDDGILIERRAANRGPLHALSTRQRVVLTAIEQYVGATGEPCPARYLGDGSICTTRRFKRTSARSFKRAGSAPRTPRRCRRRDVA